MASGSCYSEALETDLFTDEEMRELDRRLNHRYIAL